MKVFVLSLLLAAVVSVNAGSKEMHMLKKWAMHKACESCFGEENTKKFMVKIKKAYATCTGMPTPPELELSIFKNSHRVAGVIAHHGMDDHNADGHHHHAHGHDDMWMDRAVRRFMIKKMFKSFMKEQLSMDDDDDMEEDEIDMDMEGPMRFFKQSRRNTQKRRRYSRQAATNKDILDLGEKLTEKLEMEHMKQQAKIGNMTCMLKQCGMITEDNEIAPIEDMIANFNKEFYIQDKWLATNIEDDMRKCHMLATSIPSEFFEDCSYPEYLGRVKMFKHCHKIAKMRTCMNYDVRNKIENHLVDMETLVEETGKEEHELIPLVMKMLHGPEMDMH